MRGNGGGFREATGSYENRNRRFSSTVEMWNPSQTLYNPKTSRIFSEDVLPMMYHTMSIKCVDVVFYRPYFTTSYVIFHIATRFIETEQNQ